MSAPAHHCKKIDRMPVMNTRQKLRVVARWFGYTLEGSLGLEIKIDFCPFCGYWLQRDYDETLG